MKKLLLAALAVFLISGSQAGLGPVGAMSSVVKVEDGYSSGSGEVLKLEDNSEGCLIYVMTAKHVLYNLDWGYNEQAQPSFSIPNWNNQVLGGKVKKMWRYNQDTALGAFQSSLACKDTTLTPIKMAKRMPKIGARVYHIGYPFGTLSYTPLYVVNVETFNPMKGTIYENVEGAFNTYVVVNGGGTGPGSSGGAIVDKQGRLISIVSLGEEKAPGRSMTVPVFDLTLPWKD